MSNLIPVVIPALIIGTLAVLLICVHLKIQNLDVDLQRAYDDLWRVTDNFGGTAEIYSRNFERLDNERKEIEIHLYGEIRHASVEDICKAIDKLKSFTNDAIWGCVEIALFKDTKGRTTEVIIAEIHSRKRAA